MTTARVGAPTLWGTRRAVSMVAAISMLGSAALAADEGRETVVRERTVGDDDMAVDVAVDGDDVVFGLDGSAFKLAPGVALVRGGGPLTPSRPLLRGVGSARVAVDVAGLPFGDGVSGDIDATLLPWSLGLATASVGATDDAIGGRLSMRPAAGSRFFALAGSLSTLALGGRVAVPLEQGRAVVAADVGSSRGDFPFLATDAVGSAPVPLTRENNDQRLARGATVVDVAGASPAVLPGQLKVQVAGAFALREGGVPGFSTAPQRTLRHTDQLGVVGGSVTHLWQRRRLGVRVSSSASDRATNGGARAEGSVGSSRVAAVLHNVEVSAGDGGFSIGDAVDVSGGVRGGGGGGGIDGTVDRHSAHAAALSTLRARLSPTHHLAIDGGARVGVVNDVALGAANAGNANVDGRNTFVLPAGHLQAALHGKLDDDTGDGDDSAYAVGVGLSVSSRAPTLDERFAPAGFIRGNTDLNTEGISELETFARLSPSRHVGVRAAAFVSTLDNAIVVVNRNAFEVAPENTGPAARAGVELLSSVHPVSFLHVENVAALLWSEVEATKAPLPTAPNFTLLSRWRLGSPEAHAQLTVDARGQSPSTIFGTLQSPAYALIHLRGRVPVGDGLGLALAVENALDVATARDANLLPLPGRLIFVSLELRT
jgi:hypothetical protein